MIFKQTKDLYGQLLQKNVQSKTCKEILKLYDHAQCGHSKFTLGSFDHFMCVLIMI